MKLGKFNDFLHFLVHLLMRKAQNSTVQIHIFPCSQIEVEACSQLNKRRNIAVYLYTARCWLEYSRNYLKQRTLTRSVKPNKPYDLALFYVE